MVRAVIFDCDGVLVDSEILAVEVETAMLAEAGLEYERSEFKTRFMGMSDTAFYEALEMDSVTRLGRSLPPGFAEACAARLQKEVRGRLAEVAGACDAVASLTLTKAVASSSRTEKLNFKLRKVGLWEHFAPHVYSADDVTHAKPAPDLFLHTARMLDVEPHHCLVVEDSVNGVVAGRAAGMRVWGFAGGGHMDDAAAVRLSNAGAERIVANWSDATELFASL